MNAAVTALRLVAASVKASLTASVTTAAEALKGAGVYDGVGDDGDGVVGGYVSDVDGGVVGDSFGDIGDGVVGESLGMVSGIWRRRRWRSCR